MKCLLKASVVALAPLLACVGETVSPANSSSGEIGTSSGIGASSGNGSSGASSGEASSGAPDSGGLSCPTGFADCDADTSNGCETDVRSSAAHCGACGRVCGGASLCTSGECAAEELASTLPQPFGLETTATRAVWIEPNTLRGCRLDDCAPAVLYDLSSNDGFAPFYSSHQLATVEGDLYFSRCTNSNGSDCGVARCKTDGCRLEGAPFLANSVNDRRARMLTAGPGAIYTFSQINQSAFLRTATADGQLSNPSVGLIDYFQDVFVDAEHIVYVDNDPNLVNPNGGLYRCPVGGCSGPRTRLLPAPILHLAVAAGVAYVSSGERASSSILACAVTGCTDAERTLTTGQPYVGAIAADATDVYWTTLGTATPLTNTAAIGRVMRCRLPACDGGPVVIADNLVNPVSVRIDERYVYWLTYGQASLPTGSFVRRRR